MVGASFAWVATASTATSYLEIAGQMVLAGIGLGFTTAPATEAIMGVVPPEKAGVGSAVNDATRELGGTLGVAVIGSVFASLYQSGLDTGDLALTPATRAAAKESIGAAIATARQLGAGGTQLLATAQRAFFDGFQAGCLVAAGVLLVGAIFAAIFLPSRPADGQPSIDLITQDTEENQ
jgi:MFS-type transporter involved in bile tolerance (Atg22 family)